MPSVSGSSGFPNREFSAQILTGSWPLTESNDVRVEAANDGQAAREVRTAADDTRRAGERFLDTAGGKFADASHRGYLSDAALQDSFADFLEACERTNNTMADEIDTAKTHLEHIDWDAHDKIAKLRESGGPIAKALEIGIIGAAYTAAMTYATEKGAEIAALKNKLPRVPDKNAFRIEGSAFPGKMYQERPWTSTDGDGQIFPAGNGTGEAPRTRGGQQPEETTGGRTEEPEESERRSNEQRIGGGPDDTAAPDGRSQRGDHDKQPVETSSPPRLEAASPLGGGGLPSPGGGSVGSQGAGGGSGMLGGGSGLSSALQSGRGVSPAGSAGGLAAPGSGGTGGFGQGVSGPGGSGPPGTGSVNPGEIGARNFFAAAMNSPAGPPPAASAPPASPPTAASPPASTVGSGSVGASAAPTPAAGAVNPAMSPMAGAIPPAGGGAVAPPASAGPAPAGGAGLAPVGSDAPRHVGGVSSPGAAPAGGGPTPTGAATAGVSGAAGGAATASMAAGLDPVAQRNRSALQHESVPDLRLAEAIKVVYELMYGSRMFDGGIEWCVGVFETPSGSTEMVVTSNEGAGYIPGGVFLPRSARMLFSDSLVDNEFRDKWFGRTNPVETMVAYAQLRRGEDGRLPLYAVAASAVVADFASVGPAEEVGVEHVHLCYPSKSPLHTSDGDQVLDSAHVHRLDVVDPALMRWMESPERELGELVARCARLTTAAFEATSARLGTSGEVIPEAVVGVYNWLEYSGGDISDAQWADLLEALKWAVGEASALRPTNDAEYSVENYRRRHDVARLAELLFWWKPTGEDKSILFMELAYCARQIVDSE